MKYNASELNQIEEDAKNGDPRLQWSVGFMYLQGTGGVLRNPATAFRWISKAAAQGHPPAQNRLRIMYEKGVGTQPNPGLAAEWAIRAAEHGHTQAQFSLGCYYANGIGVKQDQSKAYMWLTIARDYGLPSFLLWLTLFLVKRDLTVAQMRDAQQEIIRWESQIRRKLAIESPTPSDSQ